jgi:hypothetical protein
MECSLGDNEGGGRTRIESGKAQPSTNHERKRIMTDSQGTTFPAFTARRVQHGGGSLSTGSDLSKAPKTATIRAKSGFIWGLWHVIDVARYDVADLDRHLHYSLRTRGSLCCDQI